MFLTKIGGLSEAFSLYLYLIIQNKEKGRTPGIYLITVVALEGVVAVDAVICTACLVVGDRG